MVDFGYTLSPSSRINLDNFDQSKLIKLARTEPNLIKCMACGSCAASCSAANYTKVNLRRAILLLHRGLDTEAVSLLEGCMLCGKCTLVCPRGINTRNIIRSIFKIYKEV
ncbi:MAG: 4Fe-4S dicluster domain-containing protein [Bacteroidales bacterium]